MAGFLACGGMAGLWSVYAGAGSLSSNGLSDVIQGRAARQAESVFDKNLVITTPATTGWGVLNYALFQSGKPGVVVGRDGWLFSTEEFAGHKKDAQRIRDKHDFIIRVRDRLAARDIKLAVVLVPAKARIYGDYLGRYAYPDYKQAIYSNFYQGLVRAGITVPDILAAFDGARRAGQNMYLKTDTHWTPQGAGITAHSTARALGEGAAPLRYSALAATAERHEGDLLRFMPLGRNLDAWGYAAEDVRRTPIVEKEQAIRVASNNNFLFDTQSIPFALVGTSYSANEKWGFADSLKLALQDDVLNAADEGKGPFETMKSYLKNEAYTQTPPRVVIWEIPERYLTHDYDLTLDGDT